MQPSLCGSPCRSRFPSLLVSSVCLSSSLSTPRTSKSHIHFKKFTAPLFVLLLWPRHVGFASCFQAAESSGVANCFRLRRCSIRLLGRYDANYSKHPGRVGLSDHDGLGDGVERGAIECNITTDHSRPGWRCIAADVEHAITLRGMFHPLSKQVH